MKIAYLSGAYIPSRGANSMHVMAMCQAMAKLGHDVTLYARKGDMPSKSDFEFYGTKPIFSIAKHTRPQVKVIGAIVNAIQVWKALGGRAKPDLLYGREVWALTLAANMGIPFIFESHWRPRNALHRAAEIRILRSQHLRKVVFISDALRRIYLEEFPWLDRSRTQVAHDGANPILETQCAEPLQSGAVDACQVGYVGSFQAGCGIEVLVRTASLVPEAEFHIFGGSEEEVASWKNRESDKTNLHFHGFIQPSKLAAVYCSLDIVVAPYQAATRSIEWASPMKIFEYMAFEKAIVCSDFPVLREVLQDGVTGILVEPDEPEAWARAIRNLSTSDEKRRELAVAARRSLERDFTWQGRAAEILRGAS